MQRIINTTITCFLITLTLSSATVEDAAVAELATHATEVEDALVTQPGVDALLDLLEGKKSPPAHGRRLGPFSRGSNPNRGSSHDSSDGDGSCDCGLVSPDGTKCMDPEASRHAELFFQSPKVDADADGFLDLSELKNIIQYFVVANATVAEEKKTSTPTGETLLPGDLIGIRIAQAVGEHSDTLFLKMDMDGDGKIDQREFVAVFLADKQAEAWSRSHCQARKDRPSCINPPLVVNGWSGRSPCLWTPDKANGAPPFPVWAVAVVTVLATGALVTVAVLATCAVRALKRRRALQALQAPVPTAAVVTPVATKGVELNVV